MKTKGARVFLSLIVLLTWCFAQEIKPVAVSPGAERGVARVGERCPTFSWSAVGWAAGYKIAVFEVKTAEVRTYESMALAAVPVLTQDIPGKALSWTPSEGAGLKSGGLYVWYVQARDASGNGLWSAGKTFLVELEKTPIIGMDERLAKTLRTRGVSPDAISEVSRELRDGAPSRAIAKRFTLKSSGQMSARLPSSGGGLGEVRTQGNEGDASYNVYYGTGAGAALQATAYNNTFFGYNAGNATTSGDNNTFVGYKAGFANNTGEMNTFLGYCAGYNNTTGHNNTFLGYYTGSANTTGSDNMFVGDGSGISNTTGDENTFIGLYAGYNNTIGHFNTYLGLYTGFNNTTGGYNTFLGYSAGLFNTASYSTAVGYQAGYNTKSGFFNTYIGYRAAYSNSTGDYNTALGVNAGYSNSTGLRNVFIGYSAGYSETGSDKLYIANSSTTSPLIWGDFSAGILNINGKLGIGVKSPVYPLQLASGAKCTATGVWTNASSRSFKENIRDLTAEDAYETLVRLAPVRFNYKADKTDECLGFIAEDVPALVATGDRKGLSPMDIVAVLTKVAQELQKTNDAQQMTINELRERLKAIDELREGRKAIDEQRKMIDDLRSEIEAIKQSKKH